MNKDVILDSINSLCEEEKIELKITNDFISDSYIFRFKKNSKVISVSISRIDLEYKQPKFVIRYIEEKLYELYASNTNSLMRDE